MPQWLERFRPAGTPGAAGRSGVPVDRSADAAAELTPLLLLLDDVQDEAERMRKDAIERVDEIRRTAHREADQIVTRARLEAQRVRAEAEAKAQSRATVTWADRQAQNAAEIERLQQRSAERMGRYVDRVVSLARAWLDESPQSSTVMTNR
jgi:vacuolar-type H+-ATPase subunit E/Vma4